MPQNADTELLRRQHQDVLRLERIVHKFQMQADEAIYSLLWGSTEATDAKEHAENYRAAMLNWMSASKIYEDARATWQANITTYTLGGDAQFRALLHPTKPATE